MHKSKQMSTGLWKTGPLSGRLGARSTNQPTNGTEARGLSELEALHGRLTLLEDVLLLAQIHLWDDAAVFLLGPKVVLNQIKRLLVDFLVLMTLQEFNLIQAYERNEKTSQKVNREEGEKKQRLKTGLTPFEIPEVEKEESPSSHPHISP